ncbi:alpha-amylase family glycosyl hydrolase [Paraferrimonas sedimenticola]|uniref:Alpha-amylase n=1 Tax=Paraferrimonas sedimenticola TaxID=375674 RepID=A0AA37RW59_9GAMM|nr:alpha-amylase family glycosyl hydrolase [Paraferrimonas sedimenticola]GLP95852.1 alpha-amylase [Paraferrimonas sedimenticola]
MSLLKPLISGLSLMACAQVAAQPLGPLHVPSPDWRDQVIYFVLTDRFNDGDPHNNDQGAGVYDPSKGSHYSGGDLRGISAQLDYIQALGATALWLTPPVANQWWYPRGSYGGYHGYWARNFMQVDEHYGSLQDYQRLSRQLHGRDMYLIQDIVVNHTGNYFGYDGEYDPNDTAKNFALFNEEHPGNRFPTQAPFAHVDRNNSEHVQTNAYHWTPSIQDYQDPVQEFTYQLASLADINTSNPKVRQVLKDSYRYWIDQVGVDAYRVDTAKYVEHDFWNDFLHSDDGVFAKARETGREHFLAFGEIFDGSAPMDNAGERKLVSFLGSDAKPELNSVIGFPLYFELSRVFAQGQPAAQLGYRLEQAMAVYPDPYVIPNFVDNHDTARFLASGSIPAFKQALATIFTFAGIPVIYQGDEQGFVQTRRAMFAGGYANDNDQFDTQSPLFRFIADLARLRTSQKALTRGDFKLLSAETSGAGVIAYTRSYQNDTILVLFNSADSPRLASGLGLNGKTLQPLFDETQGYVEQAKPQPGLDTLELPARAIRVYRISGEAVAANSAKVEMTVIKPAQKVLTQNTVIKGRFSGGDAALFMLVDGELASAQELLVDNQGAWQWTLPVSDLGERSVSLQLYSPEFGQVSEPVILTTRVEQAQIRVQASAKAGDAKGPNGKYRSPTHAASGEQRDIVAAEVQAAGRIMQLTLTMAEISDNWQPTNGFDNVSFAIFFDLGKQASSEGLRQLPELDAQMPNQSRWHIGHRIFGWGNALYDTQGADQKHIGQPLTPVPVVKVDKSAKQITLHYDSRAFGIQSWYGVRLYVTSWDRAGEGDLRPLAPNASAWAFGGGNANEPKIMDQVWIDLPQTPILTGNGY